MGAIISRAAEKAGLEKSTVVGSTSEAAAVLSEIAAPGDLILIKGSRLARTEDVIEAFAKQSSPESAHV
jgi:UDP-N-acetylmuramyl pentapeptide synthase